MRRRAAIGSGGLALTSAGLLACADPTHAPEPSEAAEIEVRAVQGARLCAGTQAWLAVELPRVQRETGLPPVTRLPVVLGAAAVAERCTDPDDPEAVVGCTVGDGGAATVYSTPQALCHELVHALRRHHELRTRAVLEEGFAEAIDGSDAYPRHVTLDPAGLAQALWPEALVQQSQAQFRSAEGYRVAVHFVDHLRAMHGPEAVAAFMRGGIDGSAEAALARFETHFGLALADEAEAWREAGPQGLGRGDPCVAGAQAVAPDETVELAVRIDCDEPETMGLQGAGETAWGRRCVSLGAGRRTVALQALSGTVRWEAVPGSCAEGSSALDAAPKVIDAGDVRSLDFAACTWAATFESTRDEPEHLVLTLGPG